MGPGELARASVAASASGTIARPAGRASRRCPGCGRDCDAERELCPVCGVDLDTGLQVEHGRVAADRSGRSAARAGLRWERVGRAAVVLGVLAAAIVLPLLVLGLGPFAPAERLEPALLLRAAYPGEPVALAVETVATTTTAAVADRDLSPLNLIDGDGVTAWIGLPEDDEGAGEVIQLVLERPAWVARIQLRNGDHLSPDDYERSGRLQSAVLGFDGGRAHRIDLLDIGRQAQVVDLREPELTTRVTIRVEAIFPGAGTRGVALSEVSLVGWAADASDSSLARQRARWP